MHTIEIAGQVYRTAFYAPQRRMSQSLFPQGDSDQALINTMKLGSRRRDRRPNIAQTLVFNLSKAG